MRSAIKSVIRGLATIAVTPALISFWLRASVMGRDRALEGSSQALSLIPGLAGQYLRRAFLAQTLAHCHPTTVIEFGVLFSQCGARLDENVYVGPRCHLGLVHLQRDVLLAAGVHVPSGGATHGTSEIDVPIRDQEGARSLVTIGEGAWVGSAAVIMADVGRHSVVGAAAVVTRPLPEYVVAAGVPARVIKSRLSRPVGA
jgi:acetyltransferase-like isoleucine patch superfamily enzyme